MSPRKMFVLRMLEAREGVESAQGGGAGTHSKYCPSLNLAARVVLMTMADRSSTSSSSEEEHEPDEAPHKYYEVRTFASIIKLVCVSHYSYKFENRKMRLAASGKVN